MFPSSKATFIPEENILVGNVTLYGATISNLTPYMSSGSSGYANRAYIYDPNTLYAPPPFFPTTGEYDVILWEEVLAGESS